MSVGDSLVVLASVPLLSISVAEEGEGVGVKSSEEGKTKESRRVWKDDSILSMEWMESVEWFEWVDSVGEGGSGIADS